MAPSRWKQPSGAALALVVLLLFLDHPVVNRLALGASVAPKRTALDIICDLPQDVNDQLRNTTRKCEEMFPQSVASLSDHRNIQCLKQVAGPQADEQKPRDVFCAQRGLFQPYIDCVMKSQRDMLKAYAKLSATELRAVRDGLVCMLTTWNELLRT
ncbi:uncharacterized protein LOC119385435 [Rhipicephalus sanguineus]|uniref:uncharacterized protein LOC119385435 n=1 Tax=Rhipicephalus sanguineus TaxID=34632 RepID=UPI001895567B|nr:uncharacterized protein LOC119385435 [Rhipicephalus sanguineus]